MYRIAVVIFDGVNALDTTGPLEAFATARSANGAPAYAIDVWSLTGPSVVSESGIRLGGSALPAPAPPLSLLLIPGGAGLREKALLARFADWLVENQRRFDRIASVCTGAYALAEAGLLNGRKASTHWRFAADFAARYPGTRVDPDALFLRDGKYWTAGGVASGIDLALALIAKDLGFAEATVVARELVVFLQRSGGQKQFSEPLRLQSVAPDRLKEVCGWISQNLHADLSVESLAGRANLSVRQFSRLFKDALGLPPAAYIKQERLLAARAAFGVGQASIEMIARTVGYDSAEAFRRAFTTQFGVTPAQYRERFCKPADMESAHE